MSVENIVIKTIKNPNKALQLIRMSTFGKLFGHRDYKKFIVLSRSRSGSNFLLSLLNSHSNVRCEGEVFASLGRKSVQNVLAKVYGKKPRNIAAAGFKLFYYHPQDDNSNELWKILTGYENLKVIHLVRKNILRTIVSQRIAAKTDIWARHSFEKQDEVEKAIEIDVDELLEDIRKTKEQMIEKVALFKKEKILEIQYEQLSEHPLETAQSVLDFLGVKIRKLKTTLRKQNPEPLKELIKNYQEVESALIENDLAEYLEEA